MTPTVTLTRVRDALWRYGMPEREMTMVLDELRAQKDGGEAR